jgi:hypothetical protein
MVAGEAMVEDIIIIPPLHDLSSNTMEAAMIGILVSDFLPNMSMNVVEGRSSYLAIFYQP